MHIITPTIMLIKIHNTMILWFKFDIFFAYCKFYFLICILMPMMIICQDDDNMLIIAFNIMFIIMYTTMTISPLLRLLL